MSFVLVAASKDLRRRIADPIGLVVWAAIPIAFGALMRLVFGGPGPAVSAHILLVDQDQTVASRLLARAGGQASNALQIEDVSAEDGALRIAKGDATALVIIPKGFQDGVLNERPTEISLVTNPAQRILPSVIEEGLRMMAEAAFYAQRLFGQPLRDLASTLGPRTGFPSNDRVAAISRAINQNLAQMQSTLLPPIITLETKTDAASETPGFGVLFLPGLLFMSLLFAAPALSADFWIEHEGGTLRRVLTTPQRLGAFLAGKLAANAVIMGAIVLIALAFGAVSLGVPLRRLPLAFVWCVFAGVALLSCLGVLQLLARTARGANALSQLVTFPLMMIGGSFFPFEIMPPWMASIGRWTPNGLAVTHLKALLFGQPDAGAMALAGVIIGGLAAAAFSFGAWRVRRRFIAG
jgi:ABC-type multidrug transport system permease subunit